MDSLAGSGAASPKPYLSQFTSVVELAELPAPPVTSENLVTSAEQPAVTSPDYDDYLDDILHGIVKTVVTSEGAGWSFNCDGTNSHYLQKNDVTRREPSGRFKRVYQGKIEHDRSITYKKQIRYPVIPCPSRYERWAKVRHADKCRISKRDTEYA